MIRRLLIGVLLVIACTPARRAEVPLPPQDPTRMSHARHKQLSCGSCHRGTTRPGKDDHKPCDDGACHKKEFLGTPGLFCQVCHEKVTTLPLAAPLKDYPSTDAWQTLPPAFSHKQHMDASRMESRVGFHVACADCHTRDGQKVRPDHTTCARCHAAEVGLPTRVPRMEDCAGCHQGAARLRDRKRVIVGDLHFEHERHATDRKGVPIRCEDCHTRTAQSSTYDDHLPPRVESCVNCHDDSDRTPYAMRMRVCATCHRERRQTLTTIAPRSHLTATERPVDHTLAFRRDHAAAAERETKRCAACHTQMSGNPRQACDECHKIMQPADHRITWRELDHGPEAAASRDRCATCHVVEFCSACHSQRPRSHGLPGSFGTAHGLFARRNPRACVTCHAEDFCLACHAPPAAPRRR